MADRSLNKKKFINQVRGRAWSNRNGVFVPRTEGDTRRASWPVCMTCHRDVDSVNVEDISKDVVTIRARCHGEEAVIKMEFPYRILNRHDDETMHHVRTALNNAVFFDPSMA